MLQEQKQSGESLADEAAGLLFRIGLALLCIIVPSIAFVSRRTVVVLVPIGLVMIILANTIIAEDFSVLQRIKAIMSRVVGLAAFAIAIWAIFSLLWTPFPIEAGERLLKALGTILLGFAACLSLPAKMRAPNLHLVTLGILISALISIIITVAVLAGYKLVTPDVATTARAAVLLSLLIWPALSWLITRDAILQSMLLSAIIVAAILGSGSSEALITYGAGFVVFCMGKLIPRFFAWIFMIIITVLVLGTPFLAILLNNGTLNVSQYGLIAESSYIQTLVSWGGLIQTEPMRLLTGHGFETANKARAAGMLATGASPKFIIDLWYDLGAIGALSVVILLSSLFLRCLNLSRPLIAPAMATIFATCVFAVVSNTITQIWFLSSLIIVAAAFMAIKNGQHRIMRPKPVHS